MASLREYRGNPEHKRYASLDRFDGGINTTSVDEMTYDNEFRELVNIDLIEQGFVQNRKGFGKYLVFNALLEDEAVDIFGGTGAKFPLFQVVKDTHNVFFKMKEADDLESFRTQMTGTDYELHMLVIKYINSTMKVYLLKLTEAEASYEEIYDLTINKDAWQESNVTDWTNESGGQSRLLPSFSDGTYWRTPNEAYPTGQEAWVELEDTLVDNPLGLADRSEYIDLFGVTSVYDDSGSISSMAYVEQNYNPDDYPTGIVLELYEPDGGGEFNYYYYWAAPFSWNYYVGVASSSVSYDYSNIMNIDIVRSDDKVYLALNQLSEELDGFLEYSIDDETAIVINADENYHVTSPYEVSNVGFNLLSSNPFDINKESGVPEIRNIYLTVIDEPTKPIRRIPEDGQFVLNVIYRGDIIPGELKIDIYREDGFGSKEDLSFSYELIDPDDDKGIISFDINLSTSSTSVFIKVYTEEENFLNYAKSFVDEDEMLEYFGWDQTGAPADIRANIITLKSSRNYNGFEPTSDVYGHEAATFPGSTVYGVSASLLSDKGIPLIYDDAVVFSEWGTPYPSYTAYNNATPEQKTINYKSQRVQVLTKITFGDYAGEYYIIGCETDSDGMIIKDGTYDVKIFQLDEDMFFELSDVPVSLLEPKTYSVYRTGTDPTYTYYTLEDEVVYNGSIADFEVVDKAFEDTLAFINTYEIGENDTNNSVSTMSTENIRMLNYQNRLMVYGGNTILLSDPYNFKYFPNYNYIILPLVSDDSIQRIAYFRGVYIVFTKETIHRISGTFGADDFRVTLVNDALGCVSADSVRSINNTLIFLSRDGLYTLKQSFYMEGLENVDKVDKQIKGVIPYGTNYESVVYNEQYMLFVKDKNDDYVKTVKQYYNMELSKKVYPYVVDEYSVAPDNLVKIGTDLYSIKDGEFYIYDYGYRDFGTIYTCTLMTPNYLLGYPTHDKKFKNIYLKTRSNSKHPIYITIYINDNEFIIPYEFKTSMDEDGITYEKVLTRSTTVGGTAKLVGSTDDAYVSSDEEGLLYTGGDLSESPATELEDDEMFTIGEDLLGGGEVVVHKIVVSGKGKDIRMKIEQMSDKLFGLQSIGILHKLGKVKESR